MADLNEQRELIWQIGSLDATDGGHVTYQVRRVTPTPISSVPGPLAIHIDGPTEGSVGQQLDYTLSVTNQVPIQLDNLTIDAAVPEGAVYVDSNDGVLDQGRVYWMIDSLAGDTSVSVQLTLRADQTIVLYDYHVEAAPFSGSGPGPQGKGKKVHVTQIDNLPPPQMGDRVVIMNDHAAIFWELNSARMSQDANVVWNPSLNRIYLPLTRR
ncbi:DUF11 domain-containing protein [Chloroflexi bacterium TSY]|nr:DUF11 domain-containing protein [Chloroflexi bacterium TSY]